MPIGNAIQKSTFVEVYDERGRKTVTLSAGSGPTDGLRGYTSSQVNIQRGMLIYSYDERGHQVGPAIRGG